MNDNSLKLILDKDDLERMYDFEEECMEGLVREREAELQGSTEDRVRLIGERLDGMLSKMEDAQQKQSAHDDNLQSLEFRVVRLENSFEQINSCLGVIRQIIKLSDDSVKYLPYPQKDEDSLSCLDFASDSKTMNQIRRRKSNCVGFDSNREGNMLDSTADIGLSSRPITEALDKVSLNRYRSGSSNPPVTSKIEAEAEHLREIEGRNYQMMEGNQLALKVRQSLDPVIYPHRA